MSSSSSVTFSHCKGKMEGEIVGEGGGGEYALSI